MTVKGFHSVTSGTNDTDKPDHTTTAVGHTEARIRAMQYLEAGTTRLLQRPSAVGAMQRRKVGGRWLTPSATATRRWLHLWCSSASCRHSKVRGEGCGGDRLPIDYTPVRAVVGTDCLQTIPQ